MIDVSKETKGMSPSNPFEKMYLEIEFESTAARRQQITAPTRLNLQQCSHSPTTLLLKRECGME